MATKQVMKENLQCTSKYGHLRISQDICHGHRGKMHCARAVFLLLVNAPLLKTIGKNNKLGFRPRILKNVSSRHQT